MMGARRKLDEEKDKPSSSDKKKPRKTDKPSSSDKKKPHNTGPTVSGNTASGSSTSAIGGTSNDPRIVFYYQTFDQDISVLESCTDVHLSAIHFGLKGNKPVMLLNDHLWDSNTFSDVWSTMASLQESDIKVILMIGGAGGAYKELFSAHYDQYVGILVECLDQKKLDGVNLCIEEPVKMDQIEQLVKDIQEKAERKDLLFTFSPPGNSLMVGDGSFFPFGKYPEFLKKLKDDAGIDYAYILPQCYNGNQPPFSRKTFQKLIANTQLAEDKMVMTANGHGANRSQASRWPKVADDLRSSWGGAAFWEVGGNPNVDPKKWAADMKGSP